MALIDKLNAIGDAIRSKTGKSEKMTLDEMPIEISSITTSEDTMVGTWIFNEVLDISGFFNFLFNFVLPNVADSLPFHNIYSLYTPNGYELHYVDEEENYHVPYENGTWVLPKWRTITITEEPTDAECIAWLKANARKLGYDDGYDDGYAEGEKAILSTYVDWSATTTSNSCVVYMFNDCNYYAHIHLYIEIMSGDVYEEDLVVAPREEYIVSNGEIGWNDLSGEEWYIQVTIEGFSKDGEM